MELNKKGLFYDAIGEYNPKIDYLFCRHIFLTPLENNDEALWRKCWFGEIEAFSRGSKAMIKAKMLLEKVAAIFKNNGNCYELFNALGLSPNLYALFKEALLKAYDDDLSASDRFLISCIKNKSNYDGMINEKVAHAVLCIASKHIPTIFYSGQFNRILKLTKNDNEMALECLYLARNRTESLNKKHKEISYDDIVFKILSCKDYLKETYGINEMYIYGSYAKGNPTNYSDLDIFAVADAPSLLIAEGALKKILSVVGIQVDGHIVDKKEKEKLYLTPEIRRWLKKLY